MDQGEIDRIYEEFQIEEMGSPIYTDAYNTGQNFKKFTLLKDCNVTYSDTTAAAVNTRARETY